MLNKTLDELRLEISSIDSQLIDLIAKRQQTALQIGNYKKMHNLPVFDQNREVQLKKFHDDLCEKNNIAPEMVNKIFEILINESRKVQQ